MTAPAIVALMAGAPVVSVIVPCYRYGGYVRGCVQSVVAQDGVGLDVLVIDDASPDGSWDVVRRLPDLDPRVRVERNPENLGLVGTVNRALRTVRGEYVVVLSADDALAPGALRRAVAALEEHPEATFAHGPVRFLVDGSPRPPRRRVHRAPRVLAGPEWIRRCARLGRNPVWSPEVVVRASAQVAAGGYTPELPRISDLEMWLRLASLGSVVELRGPTQAFYRLHGANMSRGDGSGDLENLERLVAAFESWHRRAGRDLPEGDALMAEARRTVARRAVVRASRALDRGDGQPVDPFIDFAFRMDPGVDRTNAYRGLRLRRRLGPRVLGAVFSPRAVESLRAARAVVRRVRGLDELVERRPPGQEREDEVASAGSRAGAAGP